MTTVPAPAPYWIDASGLPAAANGVAPRLAIVPCPAGGPNLSSALRSLRELGIGSLVSLLSAEEVQVLRLEAEGATCREVGIEYRWLPVIDHSIPKSMQEFRHVVDELQRDFRSGKAVGAHCYAGIGRSCLLMACLLCLEGLTAEEAFVRLSAARGLPVPDTWLQSQWVRHFAESLENSSEPF
jgi:protein-tyrosine phosphatase